MCMKILNVYEEFLKKKKKVWEGSLEFFFLFYVLRRVPI